MRIKDHLTHEQRKKMKSLSQRIKPPSKEKFSHKDLDDMMGCVWIHSSV